MAEEAPKKKPSAVDAFMANVRKEGGHWLWTAGRNGRGYGMFRPPDGEATMAHIWAFNHWKGSPGSKTIDHKCRVKGCVKPGHLEAVTPSENAQRRSDANANKSYCVEGHELTDDTVLKMDELSICKICIQEGLKELA